MIDHSSHSCQEDDRLAVLHGLAILDTPPDADLDRLTALACELFDIPIALVSLVDQHRQWFKSRQGLTVSGTPRHHSLCSHVIASGDALVVPETLADPRFRDNPLVTGEPHMRFYAGHPLRPDGKHIIGTLCLIGREPRLFSDREARLLAKLAGQAEALIREHARRLEQQRQRQALAAANARLEAVFQVSATGILRVDIRGIVKEVNPHALAMFGYTASELVGHNVSRLMAGPLAAQHDGFLARLVGGGKHQIIGCGREVEGRHRDGYPLPVHLAVSAIRDEQGEPVEFIGILTDLTEIQATREESQRERQLFKAVLNASQSPIYARSRHGRLIAANHSCLSLAGTTEAPVDLDSLMDRLPPLLRRQLQTAEREVIASGTPRTLALPPLARRHYRLELSALNDDQGARVGVVGVAHDTTEAVQQAELQRVLHQGITDFPSLMSRDQMWAFLARSLCRLTCSDYALIGEVIDQQGMPTLQVHAVAVPSPATVQRPYPVLTDPDTLLGRVFVGGETLMVSDVAGDGSPASLPGDPATPYNFLGIPIHDGAQRIATLAIANRREGINEALLQWLQPFTDTTALLINLYRCMSRQSEALAALSEAYQQMEQLAQRDALTGLWNRYRTEAAMDHELLVAERQTRPLTLLLFDLDHFKGINDNYGHEMGDTVLVEVSRAIEATLRQHDHLGRWGGEEFVVLAAHTDLDAGVCLAERLRARLASLTIAGVEPPVTASIGVAAWQPGDTRKALVARADRAMYRAKQQGRNRAVAA